MGDETSVILAYADALAMSRDGRISGMPFQLVMTALKKEPNNTTALWLAGLGHSEQSEFKEAIKSWQKLLPLLAGNKQSENKIRSLIAQANSQLSGKPVAQVIEPPVKKNTTTSAFINVTVSLSAQFKDKVSPDDVVFIYAKASQGPPMPLAAARKRVSDLPVTVRLDDSMAMMPQMKLSAFSMVTVGARISKSGSAIGQSGDLQGVIESIVLDGSKNIEIEINTVK